MLANWLKAATQNTVSAGGDPEAGLTLTDSFPVGVIATADILATVSVVFAADFTGLDKTDDGLIHEHGASGAGCYIGFDTSELIVRFGSGAARWNAGTTYLIIPSGDAPDGDGTLVWEFDVSAKTIRVWWNDTELTGTLVSGSSGTWTGANEGNYLNFTGDLPTGETGSPTAYTTASSLRYYENQVSGL